MTSHPYARTLQATLDALPSTASRRDLQARRALRAALDALQEGKSERDALDAVAVFLDSAHHSRTPLQFFSLRQG